MDDERARASFDDEELMSARDQLATLAVHDHRDLVASTSDRSAQTDSPGRSQAAHTLPFIAIRRPHIVEAARQRADAVHQFVVREGDNAFADRDHPLTQALLIGIAPHSKHLKSPSRIMQSLFGPGFPVGARTKQYQATTVVGCGPLPVKESIPAAEMVQASHEWLAHARKVIKTINMGVLMGTFRRLNVTGSAASGSRVPNEYDGDYQPMRAFNATNQTDVSAIYHAAYALHADAVQVSYRFTHLIDNESECFYMTGSVQSNCGVPSGAYEEVLGATKAPRGGVDAMLNSAALVEEERRKSAHERRAQLRARFETKTVRDAMQRMQENEVRNYTNLMQDFLVGKDHLVYLNGLLYGPHGEVVRGLMEAGDTADRAQCLPDEVVFHSSLLPLHAIVQDHTLVANARALADRKWAQIPQIVNQRTDTSDGDYLYHPAAYLEASMPCPPEWLKHIVYHHNVDFLGASVWQQAARNPTCVQRFVPEHTILGLAMTPAREGEARAEFAVSWVPRDPLAPPFTWLQHPSFTDNVIEKLHYYLKPCEACLFSCTNMRVKLLSMKDKAFWSLRYYNAASNAIDGQWEDGHGRTAITPPPYLPFHRRVFDGMIARTRAHDDLSPHGEVAEVYNAWVAVIDFETAKSARARMANWMPAESLAQQYERAMAGEDDAARAFTPPPTYEDEVANIKQHIKKDLQNYFVSISNTKAFDRKFEYYYRFVAKMKRRARLAQRLCDMLGTPGSKLCHICGHLNITTNFRSKLFRNRTICHMCYDENTIGTQYTPKTLSARLKRQWPALNKTNWIDTVKLFLPYDTKTLGQTYPPRTASRARPNRVADHPLHTDATFDPLLGPHCVVNKTDLERLVGMMAPYTALLQRGESVDLCRIFSRDKLFAEQPQVHLCSFWLRRDHRPSRYDNGQFPAGYVGPISTDLLPRVEHHAILPHVPSTPASPQEGILAYFRVSDDDDAPQAVLKSGQVIDCTGATIRVKYDGRLVHGEVPWPCLFDRHVVTRRYMVETEDTYCDIAATRKLCDGVWVCESCHNRYLRSGFPPHFAKNKRKSPSDASSEVSYDDAGLIQAHMDQQQSMIGLDEADNADEF